MIRKQKLFLLSSIVDESIKLSTPVYDISIFKSFIDLENYVEGTPIIIETLVITSMDLAFTSTNMTRLVNILESPFFQLTGSIIYIIDNTYDKQLVNKFFTGKNIENFAVYQDNITLKIITDIITGEARRGEENTQYEVSFMVRSDEYARMQATLNYETLDNKYITDEDELEDVPEEVEPIETSPVAVVNCNLINIAGIYCYERTVFSYLTAQYLSLLGKTIIVEHDVEFHTLTEIATKSGVDYLDIQVLDIYDNIEEVILKIKTSTKTLIVVSSVERVQFDYSYISDLLYYNLVNDVSFIVREYDIEEVTHGIKVAYLMKNMIPDVLKTMVRITQEIIPEDTLFIGLQLGDCEEIRINSEELIAIVSTILGKNGIQGQVFRANSTLLRGEVSVNDIFSIIKGIIGR